MLQLQKEKSLFHQVSQENKFKKLVLVLATSMPVTVAREEVYGTAETGKIEKTGAND